MEIWQCDTLGHYHHPRDGGSADPNFQGFGHTFAGEDGAYRFRTIKPVPYPGRAPHIHFAVFGKGFDRMTTQMYVAGNPLNQRDWILNSVRNTLARKKLIVSLGPAPQIEPGALVGTFRHRTLTNRTRPLAARTGAELDHNFWSTGLINN